MSLQQEMIQYLENYELAEKEEKKRRDEGVWWLTGRKAKQIATVKISKIYERKSKVVKSKNVLESRT